MTAGTEQSVAAVSQILLADYLQRIERLFEESRLTEAAAHTRHILSQYPRHIASYRLLAKILLEQQQHDDAVEMFQRTLSADPEDFVAYVGLAIIYKDRDLLPEAIWYMERAFELDPYNAAVQHELKELYEQRDGAAPERLQLTTAALARLYARGQLYQQAVTEIRPLLAAAEGRPDLEALLVETLWRDRQFVDAGQAAQELLTRLPDCLKANAILADIWAANGRLDEAQHYLERLQSLTLYDASRSDRSSAAAHAFAHGLLPLPEQMLVEELNYVPEVGQVDAAEFDWVQAIGDSGAPEDNWLSAFSVLEDDQIGDQLAAADSLSLADGEEGDLDWLRQVAMSGKTESDLFNTGELAEFVDDTEAPDFSADLFAQLDEDVAETEPTAADLQAQAEPLAEFDPIEVPDWMEAFAAGDADETEWVDLPEATDQPLPAADMADSESIPDWLREEFDELLPQDKPDSGLLAPKLAELDDDELPELPSWLDSEAIEPPGDDQDMGELVDGLSTAAPGDDDWLAASLTIETGELPDWLADAADDFQELDGEGEGDELLTGPADSDDGRDLEALAFEMLADDDEEEAEEDWLAAPLLANAEDLPDWLEDLGDLDTLLDQAEARPAGTETPALDDLFAVEMPGWPEQTASMEEGMTEEKPKKDTRPEIPEEVDETLIQQPASEPETDEVDLSSLAAELAAASATGAELDEEDLTALPDWLQMELDDAAQADLGAEAPALPDWLELEEADEMLQDEDDSETVVVEIPDALDTQISAADEVAEEEADDAVEVPEEMLETIVSQVAESSDPEDLGWLDQIAAGEAEPVVEEPTWDWEEPEPAAEIPTPSFLDRDTTDVTTEPPELEDAETLADMVPEDPDEAMAWLERLAAQQGAPMDELPTLMSAVSALADETAAEADEPEEPLADVGIPQPEELPDVGEELPADIEAEPGLDSDEAMAWLEEMAGQEEDLPTEQPAPELEIPADVAASADDELLDELLASLETGDIDADEDLLDTLFAEMVGETGALPEIAAEEEPAPPAATELETALFDEAEAPVEAADVDLPEDPDEMIAWLEQLAAQQEAPADEEAAVGEVAAALDEEPGPTAAAELDEVEETVVAELDYDIPEDPDEAMAWLERLAAQQGVPQEELPSISDADYEEALSAAAAAALSAAEAEVPAEPEPVLAEAEAEESWESPEEALSWLAEFAVAEGLAADDEILPAAELPEETPPAELLAETPPAAELDEDDQELAWLDQWAAKYDTPLTGEIETPYLGMMQMELPPEETQPPEIEEEIPVVVPELESEPELDLAFEVEPEPAPAAEEVESEPVLQVEVEPEPELAEEEAEPEPVLQVEVEPEPEPVAEETEPEPELVIDIEPELEEEEAAVEPELPVTLEPADEELEQELAEQVVTDSLPDWLSLEPGGATAEETIGWLDELLPDPGEWLAAEEETLQTEPAAAIDQPAMVVDEEPTPSVATPIPAPAVLPTPELTTAYQLVAANRLDEAAAAYSDLLAAGENVQAVIANLETAVQEADSSPALHRLLGDAYRQDGQLQKALDIYRQALELL